MTKPGLTIEERFSMKVEKTDTCWNWTAYKTPEGYGRVSDGFRVGYAHRLAWEIAKGPIPEGMKIDHKCHNRGCVNPDHLRVTTHKQNMENQAAGPRQSKSGVRGVFWDKRIEKWFGQVRHNRRAYMTGYFATIPEAEDAVIAKRLELFTHNDIDRRAA